MLSIVSNRLGVLCLSFLLNISLGYKLLHICNLYTQSLAVCIPFRAILFEQFVRFDRPLLVRINFLTELLCARRTHTLGQRDKDSIAGCRSYYKQKYKTGRVNEQKEATTTTRTTTTEKRKKNTRESRSSKAVMHNLCTYFEIG